MLFFSDLVLEHPENNPDDLAAWGLYAYADGVANQVSAYDIFSCTDLIFMAYRDEMQKKFGLEILTPEEADERERQEAFRRREIDVTDDIEQVIDFVKQRRRWEEKYRSN